MPTELALEKLARTRPPKWTARLAECISALSFAPHGHTVLAGALDGQLICLDAAQGKPRWQALAHPQGLLWLAHHPTLPLVATGGQDGTVKFWEANQGTLQQTVTFPRNTWMEHGRWSADGQVLAASGGRHVHFLDPAGQILGQTMAHPHTVLCLDWHPQRLELVTGTQGGVRGFSPAQAEPQWAIPFATACLAIRHSPNGKFLAAGNQDQSLVAWPDGSKEANDHLRMAGYATKVRELSWSGDSTRLSTGGGYNLITWDFRGAGPAGSSPLEQCAHSEFITAVAAHPRNPALCASAAGDRFLFLWDEASNDPLWVRALPRTSAVELAWKPSGEALCAGCQDGDICCYMVKG